MGEFKDNFKLKNLTFFLSLALIIFNLNFLLADEHLEKIENLKSENYSINVHYPSNPKVGYLDLEIEFTKIPEEIKLLLICLLYTSDAADE